MMEYVSDEVKNLLKQYKMFFKSLNFIRDIAEKDRIYLQMTKIVEAIISKTNSLYEEKYNEIKNKDAYLIDDELNRLIDLINIVNERISFIENEKQKNKEITGLDIAYSKILGMDMLGEYRQRIKIIDNYKKNCIKINYLGEEIKGLNSKLIETVKRIKTNDKINQELETQMIDLMDNVFKEEHVYDLKNDKEEITNYYEQLEFAYNMAKSNMKVAKDKDDSKMIIECDNNLSQVTLEYNLIKEKKLLLDLVDVFDMDTSDYLELRDKRQKMDDIFEEIKDSVVYKKVYDELSKQFNTIKIEQQDINTFNTLNNEKNSKTKELYDLEEINNSQEYTDVLKKLLENEKQHQEKILQEKRKQEYEERQRKLIEDRRIQEERIKRQKLIDDERKREQQKRMEELLTIQKNSVIETAKERILKEEHDRLSDTKAIPIIKNFNLTPEKIDEKVKKDIIEDIKEEDIIFPSIGSEV